MTGQYSLKLSLRTLRQSNLQQMGSCVYEQGTDNTLDQNYFKKSFSGHVTRNGIKIHNSLNIYI